MKIANILISNVWGDVSPESLNRGIGGREGAMIYLSREWAKMGHEVTNFVNIEESKRFEEGGYHEYVPLNLCKPMLGNFPWDVGIAWECPSAFSDHRILNNIKLKICEMQVCHFAGPEQEAAENFCDYVAALSEWHSFFLKHQGLNMEDEDGVVVFPNGVDITKYPEDRIKYGLENNKPFKFVYSSSPDRGLWYLLRIWPRLISDFPDSELLVGYGAQKWIDFNKWSHGRVGEMAVELEKLLKQKGVTDIGKIGQDELAELQLQATAWLYPLDAMNSTESGCITAVENAAAGNPIITTDCDCMPSEFGPVGRIVDLPFDEETYYNAVRDVLTDDEYYTNLQRKGRKFAEGRNWPLIAKKWVELFNTSIASYPSDSDLSELQISSS